MICERWRSAQNRGAAREAPLLYIAAKSPKRSGRFATSLSACHVWQCQQPRDSCTGIIRSRARYKDVRQRRRRIDRSQTPHLCSLYVHCLRARGASFIKARRAYMRLRER